MKLSVTTLPIAIASVLAIAAPQARADEYGCKVALCLLNPNGPRDEKSECRPAIDKLFDDLAHGRGMPHCEEGGFALRYLYAMFDPCKDGLTEAPPGAWVMTQGPADKPKYSLRRAFGYAQRMDGARQSAGPDAPVGSSLACVGKLTGTYHDYGGRDADSRVVRVYDRIEWQRPQSPNAIDVYQGGQFQSRFHW
ncbi:hypothetical protein [Burkholderia cepacia]|uniref:hypothetical protein n=1 Tax=Burkholderia cepacia TaxID=292 RepID=UPI002ABDA3B0|nr:hypothetical protein [Burkholderia cepacia]